MLLRHVLNKMAVVGTSERFPTHKLFQDMYVKICYKTNRLGRTTSKL